MTALSPTVAAVTESEFTSGSATHNVSMPAAAAGDLLLAILVYLSPTEISTITTSGWTVLRNYGLAPPSVTAAMRMLVFGRNATGTEGTTNFRTTQSDVVGVAQVLRVTQWRGGLNNVEISAAAASQAPGTGPDPSAVTLGAGRNLHLSILAHGKDGAVAGLSAAPSGYTLVAHTQASTGALRAGLAVASLEKLGSDDPGAFTLGAADDCLATACGVMGLPFEAGARRDRLIAEIDGIEYEVDTPEQLRQLQARAHEAELARQQLRRLEEIASRKQLQRTRERMAAEAMDRAVERAVMRRIERERAFKAQQDEIDRELVERLTLPDPIPQTRITLPKGVAPRLSSSTGLRRLGRKQ